MLIKPLDLQDLEINNSKVLNMTSAKTKIYYSQASRNEISYEANTFIPGRVTIIKSFLINSKIDKFSKYSNYYFKIEYVFSHENTNIIKNKEDLNNFKEMKLHLKFIIITMYSDDPSKYYGMTIYDISVRTAQTVNYVFFNAQHPDPVDFTETPIYNASGLYNAANSIRTIYPILESEDPCKFSILYGPEINSGSQIRKDKVIRYIRTMSEFLNNDNIEFESYDTSKLLKNDSFNEGNLLAISQRLFIGNDSNKPDMSNDQKIFINDYMAKLEAFESFSSNIFKSQEISMIDSLSLVNDRIVKMRYPFDKIEKRFLNRASFCISQGLVYELKDLKELIGPMTLYESITPLFTKIKYKPLDSNYKFTGISPNIETTWFRDEIIYRFLYDNCKSNRYRKNHLFDRYAKVAGAEELLHFLAEEEWPSE